MPDLIMEAFDLETTRKKGISPIFCKMFTAKDTIVFLKRTWFIFWPVASKAFIEFGFDESC